jgi:hypothetical protein
LIGNPELDDLVKLTEQLTGKPPTPAEIEKMKKILAS